MKTLRKILFPFSLLYGAITALRNFLYDKGIKKSIGFDIPIIAVGNLSVGGTGKTPMVEYLIRLLSDRYNLAVLSRGYKRKSKGFYLANPSTKMDEIGDEPFQYHTKFKNIKVAVHANRVEGVQTILQLQPETELVVLDDAFQHRKIKASFYIMLTAYDDLFFNDCVLPAGNLREPKWGVSRADVVVVTKCPTDLSVTEMNQITSQIKCDKQKIFFSYINYHHSVTNNVIDIPLENFKTDFIAVAGIAKPQYFFDHLKIANENCMTFPDHHAFTPKDIQQIMDKAAGKKIITTEKDYMRLQKLIPNNQLFYLPIEMRFIERENLFIDKIKRCI